MTLPDPTAADIRATEAFRRTQRYFEAVQAPGFGRISSATTPAAAPDGSAIAFAGEVRETLAGRPRTCLCLADRDGARQLTDGGADERRPRYAPHGRTIAFTSGRAQCGVQQLELLDLATGQRHTTPPIAGTVEYLHWSPSGNRILLGVAGLGADMSGGEGSGGVARVEARADQWLPVVDAGAAADDWRSVWIYDVEQRTVRQASPEGLNVWEAAWCGADALVVVASPMPDEGAWYSADLLRLEIASGRVEPIYRTDRQLGWPAADPAGRHVAIVQACCSDRWLVAGDVVLLGESGERSVIDTLGVDVTHLHWLDEHRLAFLGQRGLETVSGVYDATTDQTRESWSSMSTCGDRYPVASYLADGSAAVVHHAYDIYPELAWVRDGKTEVVASLRHAGADHLTSVAGAVVPVRWSAPDGWQIEGLLCTPDTPGPHPLVVYVHGGPVWAYRNRWELGHYLTPLLVSRGYAVLHPNPRGSGGRGQEFAEAVFGDMGGADTGDYLSGIDHLVATGVVDPGRVGVTGQSYGGFMSSWLITQDQRFAAAVPMAPVTNWYSQHNTSNIPYFDRIFLAADPHAAGGLYHERSPVMFADRVRTPTLQTTGLDDRCTPPSQAIELHQALLAAHVESVCVSYPGEGHGIKAFPAVIDHSTRVLDWFERHMPVSAAILPVSDR
ncbi:alpha/beta hydrolase family protein [Sciscionella marina]|uniref:S9 family peptidase n=1 Tax=Sciscionella marina TaxID=508770 RepID=UPI00036FA792|nr:S9 family peptidase [Sciscionella marina]